MGYHTIIGGSDGCCGDDGAKDYGYVSDDGQYICLNDNTWHKYTNQDKYKVSEIKDTKEKLVFNVISHCQYPYTKWAACNAAGNVGNFGFVAKDIDYSIINDDFIVRDSVNDAYIVSEDGGLQDFGECEVGIITTGNGGGGGTENVEGAAITQVRISEVNIVDYNNDGIEDDINGDLDGDGVVNSGDNCPNHPNPDQSDVDVDGLGDVCDSVNDNEASDVCNSDASSDPKLDSFICYDEGGKGLFSECCGCALDSKCNGLATRRVGEPIYSLLEFNPRQREILDKTNGFINENYVLKVGLKRYQPKYNLPFHGIGIKNWTSYDTLEFFVFFPFQKVLKMAIMNKQNENILDNTDVLAYSTSGDEKGRWHHIIIDLDNNLSASMSQIAYIRFFANASDLNMTQGHRDTIGSTTDDFVNIFYIDRLFLKKTDATKNKYCTRTADWFGGTTVMTQPQICQEQPGYTWTGGACCGDNPSETYIDSSTVNGFACWDGQGIANDELVAVTLT